FGTTIFGYIREQRLEMARYLLLDHGLKVSEAGYRVGFSSPAAFSSAYRRRFGHPPSVDSAAGK
ncbi:MAG: helix-turn-helix transcriptional regulator, partial [Pseudomonadota bacterium]